jgi:hypothetical protein
MILGIWWLGKTLATEEIEHGSNFFKFWRYNYIHHPSHLPWEVSEIIVVDDNIK